MVDDRLAMVWVLCPQSIPIYTGARLGNTRTHTLLNKLLSALLEREVAAHNLLSFCRLAKRHLSNRSTARKALEEVPLNELVILNGLYAVALLAFAFFLMSAKL